MDLVIIRHGESEADILNVCEGRADFELTDKGKEQANAVAEYISREFSIDKIYSSSLKRAKQTANAVSEKTNIPVIFDDNLMEFQNGLIAGLPREEAHIKYPYIKKYPHTEIYGMESTITFRSRAETALSKIINENNETSVIAVISHGGMINMLFRSFLELPVNSEVCISTGDTGIHYWKIENEVKRILFTNKLSHLV